MNTKFLIASDANNRNELLKKKIIHYYIANGDATLADLGREMDLSIPTVTKLVSELQEDGFILDFGKQDTNGGRKPNIYGLNPASGYFIGVDVLRYRVHIAAVDFKGEKVQIEENIPYTLENTREALDTLCNLIKQFINALPVPQEKILAVGINISGRVNPITGYSYSFFYFEEKPLSEIMQEKLNIKVYIENDSRAMVYGEYMQGLVKGEKNILFLNMSWGLGVGIIIDGNPYYGKSGFSGEFGHFCLFENEVICHCGKKGCLETEASGWAFHRYLLERYKEGSSTIMADKIKNNECITLLHLVEAIRKEDVLCIEILEQIGLHLGKAIAGLINIFNPELVILGGTLSLTGEYVSLPIKSAIRKHSLNLVSSDSEIKVSRLGERAGVLGACLLSRSKILGMIHY
jgi:predicted NBD/HSP70 family sugar kinase